MCYLRSHYHHTLQGQHSYLPWVEAPLPHLMAQRCTAVQYWKCFQKGFDISYIKRKTGSQSWFTFANMLVSESPLGTTNTVLLASLAWQNMFHKCQIRQCSLCCYGNNASYVHCLPYMYLTSHVLSYWVL